ncbi:hypothetical protein R69746_05788 [Paraburkholderia aspalathi]|uniref:hypothetical protein n=1 Tax=Paraburkholderia aspalathi TaxID=1324617 RepID=UPI00190977F2|nr:hypothetical protein [Paraburkholderia aspalathi]MBK3841853.1 hypothetical protein [Paraburkholderia aspalathi]CAE6814863.1 hypothetical protein R69746_05788 [Paraburkholderia aspalathi]
MTEALEQFVKKAEYARMHGWHRSYVNKLQHEGRVVLSDDGTRVDWAATDRLIGETSDPSKLGVADRWSEHRQERGGDVGTAAVAPAMQPSSDGPKGSSSGSLGGSTSGFHHWREQREKEAALKARHERELREGTLVEASEVLDAAERLARHVRDRMLMVPGRIHLQVAAETDPAKVLQMLEREVRECVSKLAAQVSDMSDMSGGEQ